MINPYAIIGGLVLLIAVVLGSVQTGRKLERSTWQAKEVVTLEAARVELAAAHAKNARIQSFNEANARKASAQHEQAISDLTKNYAKARADVRAAGGLRIPASICTATAPPEGASTSGLNEGSPGTVALPRETESRLFDIAQQADQLSEQLRSLQGWVKASGFYGEPQP